MSAYPDYPSARHASWTCSECHGEGWTIRWCDCVRRDGSTLYASTGCLCHRCAAGRWLADYYRDHPSDHPILDLAARTDLQPEELKYRPEDRPSILRNEMSDAVMQLLSRTRKSASLSENVFKGPA